MIDTKIAVSAVSITSDFQVPPESQMSLVVWTRPSLTAAWSAA